jgi:hypothetical protein
MNVMLKSSEQVRIISSSLLRNNHLSDRVKAPNRKFVLLYFCQRELMKYDIKTADKLFHNRNHFSLKDFRQIPSFIAKISKEKSLTGRND